MKRDEDDFINEDVINDLISYVEDEESDIPDDEPYEETSYEEETETYEEINEPIIRRVYEEYDDKVYFENDKKNTRFGIILGAVIGIVAVIAFITIDTGIIGNYKNNFSNNFENIFRNFTDDGIEQIIETPKPEVKHENTVTNNKVITFDNANETEFVSYRNGVICAKMNYMAFIDETGQIAWETDTAIVEPILKTAGNYILLAEKGRNKICLYAERRLLYDIDDDDCIMTANVSKEGDVVVVTSKSSYKGGISVYNKSGERIYSWASGSDTVICADISASSRRVAVSLLNTENTVKSKILLFDVNKTESYASIDVEDTVIFDMDFTGNILNAFGDNRMVGIAENGKVVYDNAFEDDVQLTHSAMDNNGNKLMSFDDGNVPMLNMYTKKGSLKETVTLTGVADFIDINGNDILYNIGRDIYFGKINSKDIAKYTATMDVKKLLIITDNTFAVVYFNSVEVVTV